MTEVQFLDRQETRARHELLRSARRVEGALCGNAALEEAVRRHPGVSLAAGAASGVVAGYVVGALIGSRGKRAVLRALRVAAGPVLRRVGAAAVESLIREPDTDQL